MVEQLLVNRLLLRTRLTIPTFQVLNISKHFMKAMKGVERREENAKKENRTDSSVG